MRLNLIPKIKLPKTSPFPKFPHFTRGKPAALITSGLKFILWVFFYATLLTNLLEDRIFETNEEKRWRYQVMKNPKEVSLHEKLGQYYLTINEKEAQKEYLLAQEYYLLSEPQKNNVLGVQTSPWERWTEITTKREKLKQQVEDWEKIHRKLPNYVYATLKLATLNYQLGDKEKGKLYLEMAQKGSPADQTVLAISEKLK